MSVCLNYADIVYSNSWTGQTGSLASTTIVTAPTGGAFYRISSTVLDRSAAGTFQLEIAWNDGYTNQLGSLCKVTGASPQTFLDYSSVSLFVGSGQVISISGTLFSGPATYDLYVVVERLL